MITAPDGTRMKVVVPHGCFPGHTFEVWYTPGVAAEEAPPTLLEQQAAQQQQQQRKQQHAAGAATSSQPVAAGMPVGEETPTVEGVLVSEPGQAQPVVGEVVNGAAWSEPAKSSAAGSSSASGDATATASPSQDDDKWYPGKYLGQAWDYVTGKDKQPATQ